MNYQYNPFIKKQTDQAYDNMVAREISDFHGTPIASDQLNKLYARAFLSCDYLFLKIVVIGAFNIVVVDGGLKVKFSGCFNESTIDADQSMVKTSYSQTLDKGITEFDILVEEDLMDFMREEQLVTISILEPVRKGWLGLSTEEVAHEFAIDDLEQFRSMIFSKEDNA